MFIFIMYSFRK